MDLKISKLTGCINQQFHEFGLLLKKGENKLAEDIKATVKEAEDRLLNEIESMRNKMREDLNGVTERVVKLEVAAVELLAVRDEIKRLKIQTSRHSNSVVACDLRINGIPSRTDEDLHMLFSNICSLLKIPVPAVRFIRRFANYKNRSENHSSFDGAIIIRLTTLADKNTILKALKEYKMERKYLTLDLIGFEADSIRRCNFYINENLTNENYKILREANKLKKKNILKSVYSFRGIVYVKRLSTDNPLCIKDIDELTTFFRNNGSALSSNSSISVNVPA